MIQVGNKLYSPVIGDCDFVPRQRSSHSSLRRCTVVVSILCCVSYVSLWVVLLALNTLKVSILLLIKPVKLLS